jgi:hypothetical protein
MLKQLVHAFSKNRTISLIVAIILLLQLGQYLFLYNRANRITPVGHVHTIENVDAYYPDVIRQGKMGAWAHTYSLTTQPTPPIYTYLFFITAGKVAALFSIDPVAMYEITRVTGGIAVILTTYWVIVLLLPTILQLPAVILTLLLETGPAWSTLLTTPPWQWLAALPPQAVIARHFGLPHHTWSEAFGLSLIASVLIAIKKPSWYMTLLILFFSICGPLINPTYFLILISCVFPVWLLYSWIRGNLKTSIFPIGLAVIGVVCAGLFTKSQFTVGSPWDAVIVSEKSWWTTDFILIPFIQSFGLYYPLVAVLLMLIPFTWKRWSPGMKHLFFITLSWSFLPVGLIYLSAIPWIPLVNGRIASDLTSVPIALLSTLVFYAVKKVIVGKNLITFALYSLTICIFSLSAVLGARYHLLTMNDQDASVYNHGNSFTLYPDKNLWDGVMQLKTIPPWSHIMVLPRIGDLLIAFMPIHVYQGQPHDGDVDWLERRGVSHRFYTGQMPHEELVSVFKSNNISYVFVGPEESYPRATPTFYPDLLTQIFTNGTVTIYKVTGL